MWQQCLVDVLTRVAQRLNRSFQVDRVPQDDGGHHQVEAARAVALVLEAAVAEFPEPVQKHGAGQRVPGLALVQTDLHAAAQFDVLHPVQREPRALDAAEFAERGRQTVLAGIAAKLAQHQRGGDGTLLDRRR